MGGQEGDCGVITGPEGEFTVETTIKLKGGKIGHVGVMTKGMLKKGDKVTLSVMPQREPIHARITVQHICFREH